MVDLPTWYAGYFKQLEEAKTSLDPEDFKTYADYEAAAEKQAFKVADWTVENVQGSGSTKDLPAIMRESGELTRTFTMFMTFFSSLWNMERDTLRGGASGQYSPTTIAAKAMFLFAIPVAAEMYMRGDLKDDDDETAWERYLTDLALYPAQTVPFLRDAVNGTLGDYKYQMSPIAGTIESGLRGFSLLTDDEISKSKAKGASKLIGAWYGIPGIGQVWNTSEHIYEVMEEGEELTVREFLFGPERK